ncbi:THUMP domain-containing protein 1 [Wickerhamomyces ciferrii]|uniref:THUMP domain-containing protein 1 n=1 Tax=Wickerhamomyces ciferrii (strain ATCC 14091 / BCRC 22168 / CBS 111 / JCM 3599 / NBRC 0793 / NRRL Y-1031 F-60-10) TaxID=1206466 RepID=K0KN65_WICCF|nr:THUMP domain-containing protein 1 [Wickerhamomyces ciferrii]CCH42573.1 THUMP domain-containing protein 1 [Wickerhamomyces ciferrii]
MGEKRRNNGGRGQDRKKKYKVATGIIDPQTSGIYATCNRHHEKQCEKELKLLFDDKFEQFYKDVGVEEDEDSKGEEEELSIEESIKRELEGLQQPKEKDPTKKEPFQFIDLGCECVVFVKTRKPVDPTFLVEKICEEAFESKIKNTRYTQKLTPITWSSSASIEELTKLAKHVLAPHFHQDKEIQKPLSFAVKVSSRNFNTIEKMDIITKIAECVGRDHGHKVDLKKFDKLILVECFKNNIGMSVVNNYEKYQKYNLQQIFEKQLKEDNTLSRSATPKIIKNDEVKEESKESKESKDEQKNEQKESKDETPKESTTEPTKTQSIQVDV